MNALNRWFWVGVFCALGSVSDERTCLCLFGNHRQPHVELGRP